VIQWVHRKSLLGAWLGSRGFWRSKHQGLIAALGEHLVKPGLVEPKYGRILHDAFETRLDSDYAPHPDLHEDSARNVVRNAADFVQRMERLLEEHGAENEVQDGIQ